MCRAGVVRCVSVLRVTRPFLRMASSSPLTDRNGLSGSACMGTTRGRSRGWLSFQGLSRPPVPGLRGRWGRPPRVPGSVGTIPSSTARDDTGALSDIRVGGKGALRFRRRKRRFRVTTPTRTPLTPSARDWAGGTRRHECVVGAARVDLKWTVLSVVRSGTGGRAPSTYPLTRSGSSPCTTEGWDEVDGVCV